MLAICRECGTDMRDTARTCPKCGAAVRRTKWWLWALLGVIALLFVMGSMHEETPLDRDKASLRNAISACWEVQGKKSNGPFEAADAAKLCEGMEREFESRFRVKP